MFEYKKEVSESTDSNSRKVSRKFVDLLSSVCINILDPGNAGTSDSLKANKEKTKGKVRFYSRYPPWHCTEDFSPKMQKRKEADWLNRQQFTHQGKKTHPNNKTKVHGIIEKNPQKNQKNPN